MVNEAFVRTSLHQGEAAMQTGYALRGEATGHPKGVAVKVPDEALIASIAHGDRSAMQVLYARHSVRSSASSCA